MKREVINIARSIMDNELEKQLKQAYRDDDRRFLMWKSFKSIDYEELKKLLPLIGQYNYFNPETIINAFKELGVGFEFILAREYSVALYLKPKCSICLDRLNKIIKDIKADEFILQNDGLIRLWWD